MASLSGAQHQEREGEANEIYCANHGGDDGGSCGLRNHAQNADLPRRVGDRRGHPLSTATAAAAASSAADGELSGRIDGPGRRDLSGSAAATAAPAPGASLRRTRLNRNGRRQGAGRHLAASRGVLTGFRPIAHEPLNLLREWC